MTEVVIISIAIIAAVTLILMAWHLPATFLRVHPTWRMLVERGGVLVIVLITGEAVSTVRSIRRIVEGPTGRPAESMLESVRHSAALSLDILDHYFVLLIAILALFGIMEGLHAWRSEASPTAVDAGPTGRDD
jgi:hypothetical protein